MQMTFEVSEKNILVKRLDILFNEKLQITYTFRFKNTNTNYKLKIQIFVLKIVCKVDHLITEMKSQR